MKKLIVLSLVVTVLASCSDSKKEGSVQSTTDSTAQSSGTTGEGRAKEISDSTRMLDKQLADSNSTMTPDSLK